MVLIVNRDVNVRMEGGVIRLLVVVFVFWGGMVINVNIVRKNFWFCVLF